LLFSPAVIKKLLRAAPHHVVAHPPQFELLVKEPLVIGLVRILLTDEDQIRVMNVEYEVTKLVLANTDVSLVPITLRNQVVRDIILVSRTNF
jgi:hypothetical protein